MTDVMELTSSAIRSTLMAPPGMKLVIADLSNIEGRMLAWLAGEEWKLQAFRDFDNGTGHDLYKLAYGKSFGVDPGDVTKDQRQVGKVQELALGFASGVGGFLTFARAYNIDLEKLADEAAIPEEIMDQARGMLEWHRGKGRDPDLEFGLSERAWLTCEAIKTAWRLAHPNTVSLWKAVEDGFRTAIDSPGKTLTVRRIKIRRDGNWLRMGLPSGRCLCYPFPEVDDEGALFYKGINQFNRKWLKIYTYSGKLVENLTQAAARDAIAHNMPLIESSGYPIILTVHDEVLTEVPDRPEYNVNHLSAMLARVPEWAEGLPLAAAGFETYSYKKE
jgi:DNA polymerase